MSSPSQMHVSPLADTSDVFATVDFLLKRHVSPHGRVTAISMMKDEGPFVLEWVAHHLSLGFTDLVIYTNDCSDGTDDMVNRLEELGLAHHRRNDIPDGIKPQPSALKYAQEEPLVRNSDWILILDADEFLCIKQGDGTVDGLIKAAKAQDANGIVITWRIYGSSRIQTWSPTPVTEQYLSAAPPMWNKGWGVKTLFAYDPNYWKLGIHRPKIKNKHLQSDFPHSVKWLNGSGRPMEDYFKFRGWRSIVRTVGFDWAQMNHYAVKSMESYAIRQFRGNVNNKANKYNANYWALQDRNEVYDDAALSHKDGRQRIFDLLLADPVLSKLHFSALEKVEARLAIFRETPEYASLMAELKAAAEVPITKVDAKPPKARDPAKIARQMSRIERAVTTKPNTAAEIATPEAHPYVTGSIDLGEDIPLTAFENHHIAVKADPRVFSTVALQAITEGKFMRNLARRLPGLLVAQDRYLEVGAGVAFLPAVLAQRNPNLRITAQEENDSLRSTAERLWRANGIEPKSTRSLLPAKLIHPTDGKDQASGLLQLVNQTECTVLFANDPQLSAEMIADALQKIDIPLPRCVIAGPRAQAGACDADRLTLRLRRLGYNAPENQPLNGALLLIHTDP